ncbi:MAG: twin-arginine translocation signal domain-containing protein [Candidatus Aminicenantaceae bacterium]
MPQNKYLNRRNFLKGSSLGMLGAGFSFRKSWSRSKDDVQKTEKIDKPKVKEYRILGRTGFKAEVCGECEGSCERACPYGVPIQGKLILAHDQLSLAE